LHVFSSHLSPEPSTTVMRVNPILSSSLVALVTLAACTDPSADELGAVAQDLKSGCPNWG